MLVIQQTSIFKYSNSNEKETTPIQDEELILYLNEEVKLDNINFQRIFELILLNYSFFDIVYYRALGGFSIKDFEEDFLIAPQINDLNDVEYILLKWHADLYYDNENVANLSFLIDLSGKSYNDDEIGYSLTMSALNEYKHLPLKIDTSLELYNKDNVCILNANRNMTLYDVIRVILYEITFYGTPKNREIVKDEILKATEGLDLNENIRTLSFDDLFQNIKDQMGDDIKPV